MVSGDPTQIFTRPDAWTGTSYDLLIKLGRPDDERLAHAIAAVWSWPDLEGCYLEIDREPSEQPRVAPVAPLTDDGPVLLRGVARIGGRAPVACSTYVVREPAIDWIYLGVSLGSLGRLFPVGAYPLDDGSDLSWRTTIDEWLCSIARSVWAKIEFDWAVVGGLCDVFAQDFGAEDIRGPEEVPRGRWVNYLVRGRDGLVWCPTTQGAPVRDG